MSATGADLERLTSLRWYVEHKWADPTAQAPARKLLDELIGFPGASAGPSVKVERPTPLELPVIAVVVGHNEAAQGADALEPIGMSEFPWNSLIAERMVDLGSRHGFQCVKFLRRPAKSYTSELAAVYKAVNSSGAIASIELHFNDAGPSATGTETLVSESAASKALGGFVQAAMVRKLGLTDRRVKVVPRGARGSASVYYGSMPGILVEPFFGGNRSDVARAAGIGIQGFAEMYLEGLQHWALSRA